MTIASRKTALTGIKPTGIPHLGNYVGAIRPALRLVEQYDHAYYFIADYHAVTTISDPKLLAFYTRSVTATWLACGLDPDAATFYRQSDVPETYELAWILACVTAKGLMNRAHAYKAALDRNRVAVEQDLDAGVNMGLYNYPILMAADILLMESDVVPVGKDQVQHLEYAQDIAERFNRVYGQSYSFKVPEHITSADENENAMPGLDGRKMSKSYDNTIPLFCERAELRKLVRRLKTDSAPVEAPKDPAASSLFAIYKQFASDRDRENIRVRLVNGGLGWGELKEILFEELDRHLAPGRERYKELMEDTTEVQAILQRGAEKARLRARRVLEAARTAVGIG
jgi:tryptophanyl-tRNA synthetase